MTPSNISAGTAFVHLKSVCGTCKHWKPFGTEDAQGYHVDIKGFGTCGLAQLLAGSHGPPEQDKWLFGVTDLSDCFAALKTKESFGCNQWEPKA